MKLTNIIRESIASWLYPQSPHTQGNGGDLLASLDTNSQARKFNVNPKTALSIPAVLACIKVIAETIATLPCHIYERNGEKTTRTQNHSLDYLLHHSPNEIITKVNFFETIMVQTLIFGNAFIEIERNKFLEINALHILNPENMSIKIENGSMTYEYNDVGIIKKYSPDDIIHVAGLGGNGLIGLSPIYTCHTDLSTMLSQSYFSLDFFSNGAKRTPVLTSETKLHKDTKQNLKNSFRESWHKGIVLLEEGIKVEPMTMALSDAQFLESKQYSLQDVCRIYRVPPHMVADLSHATFSNIEQQYMAFVRETILTWCVRLENAFGMKLFKGKEQSKYFIKFVIDGLLRGDTATRQQAYKTQLENGIITINEWRKLENLPAIDEPYANDRFISQQLRPIKTAYMVDENKNENIKELDNDKKNNDDDDTTNNNIK